MLASPDSAFIYTSAGISVGGVGVGGSAMKRQTFMQAGGAEETCPTNSQKATREPQTSNPDTKKKKVSSCLHLFKFELYDSCRHASGGVGVRGVGVLVERLTLCHLFRLQRRSALARFT